MATEDSSRGGSGRAAAVRRRGRGVVAVAAEKSKSGPGQRGMEDRCDKEKRLNRIIAEGGA